MQMTTPVSCLVLHETLPLARLAKWSLRAVLLLGAMVALASRATAAPVVFDVSAQSDESWAVSGTITIDTATGKVLSADLAATINSQTRYIFDVVGGVSQIGHGKNPAVWTEMSFFESDPFSFTALYLTVPEATLVGYKGSALVPGPASGHYYTSSIEIAVVGDFYSGPEVIPLFGSVEPK